jgi:hypothetical protein
MSFKSIIIGVLGVAVLLIAAYFLVFNSSQQVSPPPQQSSIQNNSNLPQPPPMPTGQTSIGGLGGGSQVLNFTFTGQKLKVGNNYYVEFINYSSDSAGFELLDSNSNIIGNQTLVLNKPFSTPYYSAVLTRVENNSATLDIKFNIPV